jgi:hypothetical protein
VGITIDTSGFSREEAKLAVEVVSLDGEAAAAAARLRRLRRLRDEAARAVRSARAEAKRASGRAYRAQYRLEKMIGYEEGTRRGRRFLAKDPGHCRPMDADERGRYAEGGG